VIDGTKLTSRVFAAGLDSEQLKDRVAVITGASRGIGAGIAQRFCDLGIRVGICARKRPDPPSGADRHQVLTIAADVRDSSDLEGLGAVTAERFGQIDIWVNNAGVLEPVGMLAEVDPGRVAHQIAVNVTGVANGTRTFARHVRRREGGGILINVTSGAARSVYPGWAVYCASKAAVDQMTAVVAVEEEAHGLRAYAVAPGLVDTDMQEMIRRSTPEAFPAVLRFIEAKRTGEFNSPAWVADAILELSFGETGATSGSVVKVPNEWERRQQ
jgi:benzil reductase ((S)-benzoin forming)